MTKSGERFYCEGCISTKSPSGAANGPGPGPAPSSSSTLPARTRGSGGTHGGSATRSKTPDGARVAANAKGSPIKDVKGTYTSTPKTLTDGPNPDAHTALHISMFRHSLQYSYSLLSVCFILNYSLFY